MSIIRIARIGGIYNECKQERQTTRYEYTINELKGSSSEKTRQPYMSKIIQQPYIDEDKLLLIMFIVDNLQIPKSKADKYIITTMLVQIALDTHESVQNEPLPLERLKGRQLTILAGTYYSGLYYQILAEIDDIFMIRTLAEGIMEVNEHKVSVYSHARVTVESLMESLKRRSPLYLIVLLTFTIEMSLVN